ncbi:rhodanese-like domain-containing protein [Desulfobulbus elongatus]|uniref:rhodanese-like domain-containing protein n=1 Tax=Desulfobulbus elongatus TaxID=53332 RepID=UPI000AE70139|nr:rhodanese-like domain-containing protein [Desulfobulbus elongatus]
MNRTFFHLLPLCLMSALLVGGCAATKKAEEAQGLPARESVQESGQLVYEGEITSVSERAKSISIVVGKGDAAKVMMVKFDGKTKGMSSVAKGRAAKVFYEMRGDKDAYATEVQLKLAKLPEGITEIRTAELAQLIKDNAALMVYDSRPKARYDQAHLPGAISLPLPKLEERQAAALPKDKNTPLVFYCGGITCPLSPASAAIAKKLGYTNIRVYNEGEPEWTTALLPTYSTKDFILNGNVVVIDLRPSQKALAGRIKGAYSVPYESLEDKLGDVARNAPLVLYGDREVFEVVKELRGDGFSSVTLVEGGYEGWVKSGGAIEKGPIFATEIKWVRKLGKGEVSVADFRKAVSGEDKDVVVIDARTKEEVAELGIFRNTVNIPLDEIPARMNELPKDKKIYVHCSTGARADMAYNELINAGYNAKFLLLNIQDAECDCEIIRP